MPPISPELRSKIDDFLEKGPAQAAIDNFVYRLTLATPEQAQVISEYVANWGQRSSQQLEDVLRGRTRITLDEAKQFYLDFARRFSQAIHSELDIRKELNRRQQEPKDKLATLTRLLPEQDREDFTDWAEGQLDVLLTNREQIGSDKTASQLLFYGALPSLAGLPTIPSMICSENGNCLPWTSAHTVTPEGLTKEELASRRFYHGLTQLVHALPAFDGWLPLLFEAAAPEGNGTPVQPTASQIEIVPIILDTVTALLNERENQKALVNFRGYKQGAWLQLGSVANDMAASFINGVRMNYRAYKNAIRTNRCQLDPNQFAQVYQSKAVQDWLAENKPAEGAPQPEIPTEIWVKGAEELKLPKQCGEAVNATRVTSQLAENFYHPSIMARIQHGLVSDQSVNNGVIAGLLFGAANMLITILGARAVSEGDPEFRYSLTPALITNPEAGTRALLPGEENIGRTAIHDAGLRQARDMGIATGLSLLSMDKFELLGKGSRYNPHFAASLMSTYDEILRVAPREEFIATMFNDSAGSSLPLAITFMEEIYRYTSSLANGYMDGALLHRVLKDPTAWNWSRFALVMGGRIAARAMGAAKVADVALLDESCRTTQWVLYGMELGTFLAGFGTYFLLGRERVDLGHVSLGGENMLSIIPNPDSPQPFEIGVTPEARPDGFGVKVGFSF